MVRFFIAICVIGGAFISGCTINTNLMLKTDKEYVYAELSDSVLNSAKEYRLAPSDIIQFRMYDNGAWILLNTGISTGATGAAGGGNNQNRNMLNQANQLKYLIDIDSTVKLPILDRIKMAGLTVREAEDTLESMYSKYYNEPFVQINITNKRVIIFPGNGGDAQVVTLQNNNTTLMEALGYAKGVAQRGRADHIKLMRNVDGKRYVYKIDLSTIEGLKYTDMLVQANDYIYVEPVPEVGREVIRDIAPIISLLSSTLLVYSVFKTFNN